MVKDHVNLRQTRLGRWLPAVFYLVNMSLWMLTAMMAGDLKLLGLSLFAMPALVIYILRTRQKAS